MVLLSVIIPVYRVEEYLTRCLDSVLRQPFTDLEVVAVDDASDDGCAEILARYAATEPRLRVVTLDHNQGLGAARNAGLASATGTYVWFVDSDDWLPDGTLTAVANRLTQTRPDLLVTGFSRVYWDGRVRTESVSRAAGPPGSPPVFALRDRPALLSVLHIACNKIIRRRFLTDLGLTFADGWYEDVSFSFPLMIAAERISLLDRDCYVYRQRRTGGITHTVSGRHFELFPHWDRVFAFLAERPEIPAELRGQIFQRMIWHFLQVLGHAQRVPAARRREFFTGMVVRFRKHRPVTGYQVPPGAAGIKHRLVAGGAYRLFEALRRANRVGGVLARRRTPVRSGAGVHPAATSRVWPAGEVSIPGEVVVPRKKVNPGELPDRVR
ncbi:glycosyltransferase family 2 protein [Micromonospora sp. NBC_01796]|uniref:glycosyltransferase family 2 protein n=1 Tax=Micromonospora sp. NBC_01796 TaxID=2975987 RepID=UPI002DD8C2CC|nr:glycosyltransferase family 2 protein [Micromonospora sp. NBC_01796]WSA82817.1 glycosyltransferase [Micromonospora sp. NBC_01796]